MAPSPVPVLIIIGVYVAFYAVMAGTAEAEVNTYGVDQDPGIEAPSGGVFSAIADVFSAISTVFDFLIGALTFNVDGAPFWVRIPVGAGIIGSLAWSVVTLIRGD